MKIFGYHRTSTKDQHLDRGIKSINEYAKSNNIKIDVMFKDQQTGKNFDRPDYNLLKRIASSGDVIIISELDRLGRNKKSTLEELQYFKKNGIRILILELPTTLTDYTKLSDVMASMMMETINNMLIEMYASLAHAEMLKREKRQREGIEAMKARGEWYKYGRKNIFTQKNGINKDVFISVYNSWKRNEITAMKAFTQLGISKATFYRQVKIYEESMKAGVVNG